MSNAKIAEELLKVLMNSKSYNPAWVLQEVLNRLYTKLCYEKAEMDSADKLYIEGWYGCLRKIDDICEELDKL